MSKYLIIFSLVSWLFTEHKAIAQQEKFEPRIDLTYFKISDDVPYIKVLVRKRVERRYFPVEGMPVKVFFNEETDKELMGSIVTNSKGEGIVEMPTELMDEWHHTNEFDYIATIDESDTTESVSEALTIRKAKILLQASEQKGLTATVLQLGDSLWVPVEEVELKFFVKRNFGRLLLSDDIISTDAEGVAGIQFDMKIPGNAEGKLELGCVLEDHDEFGNVIAYVSTKWGIPFVDNNEAFEERTLWSTRDKTPYWLLIFPNLLILSVWGIIIYLVLQIVKIKRLSNLK